MLTVIVTITGRSICSVNSYCDNDDNNGGRGSIRIVYSYCTTMVLTGRYVCSVSSYCDTIWGNLL